MTELPHGREIIEPVESPPQGYRAGFAVVLAPHKPSQLRDPAHGLPHGGRLFGGHRAALHITAERFPFGLAQPSADGGVGFFARRLAQRQEPPGYDQVHRECPLQASGSFQLSLFDLTAALEHFVEHFDLPALRIPPHFFQGFLGTGHRQRGHQSPHDGRDAFGRSHLSGFDGPHCEGRLPGLAPWGSHGRGTKANRQGSQSGRLFAAAPHSNFELSGQRRSAQGVPQRQPPALESAVVAAAHQYVHARPAAQGRGQSLSQEVIEIAFAVREVDQDRVGTFARQGLTRTETVEPLLTFLLGHRFAVALPGHPARLGVTSAHRRMEQSQRSARRRDGQCGVQEQTDGLFAVRADGTQALGLRMSRVVEGGRVLNRQHQSLRAHAPQRGSVMGLANRVRRDALILEEAIGPLASRPWPAGLRDGSGGLLSEGRRDHAQTLVETLIGQLGASEFMLSPVGGLSGWRTKHGCIGFKHPTIEYISGCGTRR